MRISTQLVLALALFLFLIAGCTPAKVSSIKNTVLVEITTYDSGCRKMHVRINRGKAEDSIVCPKRGVKEVLLHIPIDQIGELPHFIYN